jgi:NitT/TauT family transport system substrate-binding protein
MNKKLAVVAAVVVAILLVAGIMVSGVLNPSTSKGTIKYMDVAPVYQQAYIQQGLIDGGVSWEPYVSDSVSNGTAHALITSHDLWPNHPCCVVVASNSFLQDNNLAVLKVLKAHIEANRWIAQTLANKDTAAGLSNYTLLLNIGADFSARNTTVVGLSLQNMVLTNNLTAQTISYLKTFTQAYIDSGIVLNNSLSQRGFASVDAFLAAFVNTTALTQADALSPVVAGSALTNVSIAYLQGDLHQFARVVAENKTVGSLSGLGDRSLFEAYGIKTVKPTGMPNTGYVNGGAVMTAFGQGVVDIGYLGAPPAILNRLNVNVQVTVLALANTEGSALVVKNSITSIDKLDGLVIGEPGPSSIQFLMLLEIAKQHGYTVVKK